MTHAVWRAWRTNEPRVDADRRSGLRIGHLRKPATVHVSGGHPDLPETPAKVTRRRARTLSGIVSEHSVRIRVVGRDGLSDIPQLGDAVSFKSQDVDDSGSWFRRRPPYVRVDHHVFAVRHWVHEAVHIAINRLSR